MAKDSLPNPLKNRLLATFSLNLLDRCIGCSYCAKFSPTQNLWWFSNRNFEVSSVETHTPLLKCIALVLQRSQPKPTIYRSISLSFYTPTLGNPPWSVHASHPYIKPPSPPFPFPHTYLDGADAFKCLRLRAMGADHSTATRLSITARACSLYAV